MQEAYIGLRSLTHAQRAARYLTGRGLTAAVVRAPWTGSGCAYALRLRSGDVERARTALQTAGFVTGSVFLRDREGNLREAQA